VRAFVQSCRYPHQLAGVDPERLRGLLRRHNGIAREAAQMRLRAAAHVGPVYTDAYGAISDDLDLLFRMLEAAPLRKALALRDEESRYNAAIALGNIGGAGAASVAKGQPATTTEAATTT